MKVFNVRSPSVLSDLVINSKELGFMDNTFYDKIGAKPFTIT